MIELKRDFHPTFFIKICSCRNILPPQHRRNARFVSPRTRFIGQRLRAVGKLQQARQKVPDLLVRQAKIEQSCCASNNESHVWVKLSGPSSRIFHKREVQSRNQLMIEHIPNAPAFNAVYTKHFQEPYPARTTVAAGLRGFLVEIDLIAVR